MSKHTFSLPNILTYVRIITVPLIVLCFCFEGRPKATDFAHWVAVAIFIFASVTDFFDGYLARAWKQTSNIGRLLDPIADKLLVSSCLLLLAYNGTFNVFSIWAAVIILCREILVSGLREYLADLRVGVPVSQLAKWKTAVQMFAIVFLLAGSAGDKIFGYTTITGIILLWIAAILTLITGWDYFRHGLKHVVNHSS